MTSLYPSFFDFFCCSTCSPLRTGFLSQTQKLDISTVLAVMSSFYLGSNSVSSSGRCDYALATGTSFILSDQKSVIDACLINLISHACLPFPPFFLRTNCAHPRVPVWVIVTCEKGFVVLARIISLHQFVAFRCLSRFLPSSSVPGIIQRKLTSPVLPLIRSLLQAARYASS